MVNLGSSVHLVTLGQLARLLRVAPPVVYRFERAGLLRCAGFGSDGKARYHDSVYPRLRLYLDLLEAGATMAELHAATDIHEGEATAAVASQRLVELLGVVLARQQQLIERQKSLRADLIASREALLRCGSCHRPVNRLACRTCATMPARLPRAVNELFCPEDRNSAGRR
jgi:DNA-binding transcriptional MerR regulator